MKKISIVSPCYNEEDNVKELYLQIKQILGDFKAYIHEIIFIDNASNDNTVKVLKELAGNDESLKIIVNSRNFGHLRSPYHGFLQAGGDAAILIASDFQDPPALIRDFIKKWEEGFPVVIGVRKKSEGDSLVLFRKFYYYLINCCSEEKQIKNFTGFGLYDRKVIDFFKETEDPYPYLRGLLTEFGFERAEIPFVQPPRKKGKTKNNLYTLYDLAILGFVHHSKIPLRVSILFGFLCSFLCMIVSLSYFVYKLLYWNTFSVGMAPLIIGFFFFASLQFIFIGILGEYVMAIFDYSKKRPLVIEKERINF